MKVLLSVLMCAIAFGLSAQDDRVLLTIDEHKISVDEFLAIYNKNNTNNVVDKKTMEEYMDLFINFKLKVVEAESLGMDTAQKFINELSKYRSQLAEPYLVDRETTDQLVKEAYERMKQDVEAYHILVKLAPDASPSDTLKAWNKINAMRQSAKDLEEFKRIAKNESEDPSAKENEGYLGYFTAFQMVYPFETAAFNTEEGKVSKPIRTRFGYHIIYTADKRPARGEMRAAHIMIKAKDDVDSEEALTAEDRINEIYQRLEAGEDFAELAKLYSEDMGSANKGGLLPWFGTGRMVEEFEDAAFALKENGDYSKPVKSKYGWHIIKREDYRGLKPFEEIESSIKRRIERDSRGEKGRESLIKKLKSEYSITFDYKNRSIAEKLVNQEFLSGKWKPENVENMTEMVMQVNDPNHQNLSVKFTQADYLNFLRRHQERGAAEESLSTVLDEKWKEFVDESIINFEDQNLENKYPEFRALMQEYHDGILLFDLMDQKVWSKAVKDTTGLQAFYEENKEDFMWDKRVDASIFLASNEKIAKKARKMASKREKKGYTDKDILEEFNEDNPLNLNIRSGVFAKGDDEVLDEINWSVGISDNVNRGDKVAFVEVREVLPPQPKKLAEARGIVTSAYQDYLEKQWINELRSKYTFTINQKVFDDIRKQ